LRWSEWRWRAEKGIKSHILLQCCELGGKKTEIKREAEKKERGTNKKLFCCLLP
jgi:hypothetical protein